MGTKEMSDPDLRMRQCIIQAFGCEVAFIPVRPWQTVCKNPLCKKENMRRLTKRWRKNNPEYHKEYNREYARL
jgi:mannosyltransferase OCH1-like enzyme